MSPELVLWVDLMSFRALHDSVERLEIMEKQESLKLMRAAQHADVDTMKDIEYDFEQQLASLGMKTNQGVTGNAAEFLKKYPRGI